MVQGVRTAGTSPRPRAAVELEQQANLAPFAGFRSCRYTHKNTDKKSSYFCSERAHNFQENVWVSFPDPF